jgi:hypothetical protein
MNARTGLMVLLSAASFISTAHAQNAAPRTESPKGAAVYFHYPLNNVRVGSKFTVRIGLRDMGVAPAGIKKPGTGHHHLLIDAPVPPLDQPIPNDPQHIHLGGGQTEVVVTLPPGKHTLQLVVADYDHVPHDPPVMSQRITVFVSGDVSQAN